MREETFIAILESVLTEEVVTTMRNARISLYSITTQAALELFVYYEDHPAKNLIIVQLRHLNEHGIFTWGKK